MNREKNLNVNERRRHLQEYLTNDLFYDQELPPTCKCRLFTTKKDLPNQIYRSMLQNRFCKCDQTNAFAKVKEWQSPQPKDMFYFRSYAGRYQENDLNAPEDFSVNNDKDDKEEVKVTNMTFEESLFFVHQTDRQRRLLMRYGNNICLLDML